MTFSMFKTCAVISALAAFAVVGCSTAKPARPVASALTASSLGATNNPNGTFELNGTTLRVWEDKLITFAPAGGGSGTYAISGAPPAWATFDATTGTLSGTPRTSADTGTFTITQSSGGTSTVFGPYTIEIVGDVMKEQQWHLINSGQAGYARSGGTSGQDIVEKTSVRTNVFGAGVNIAVSDTGTLISHPDLAPNNVSAQNRNYLNNYNSSHSWLGDPTPSYAQADYAHGTAVAGLAAAKGWNGIGGRGVASEANFSAFLFIQAQTQLERTGLYDTGLMDQFNGSFDVGNYSWGDAQCAFTEYNDAYFAKLKYGVTNQRGGRGSIFVMAGGNDWVVDKSDCGGGSGYAFGNANFTEALTSPYMVAVGAINADGISSSYSSPGSALWVTAPGGEYGYSTAISGSPEASEPALVTTDFAGCGNGLKSLGRDNSAFDAGGFPNTDCYYTSTMNGSSGATPITTGTVALMLSVNPNLTWRDVKYVLATTADRVDASRVQNSQPGATTQLSGHAYELPWTKNAANHWFHDWYGFGRVNVDSAVAAARLYAANSLGTLTETNWIHDSGTISVSVPTGATGATNPLSVSSSLVIEAVQARISVTGCAADVGLELKSPSGTVSYLMNVNSGIGETNISNHRFLSNAFLDENTNGTWTLRVVEGKTSCTPVLTHWSLNFFGH